jgi:hypothetical protein
VAAGEERVLARDCLRPDRPLDDIGIDLNTAVDEEAFENFAAGRGVSMASAIRVANSGMKEVATKAAMSNLDANLLKI